MNMAWFRYLVQIAPWLTLVLVMVMMSLLYGTLAPAPAVSMELPVSDIADTAQTGLVALLMPGGAQSEGTLVFFDDARYVLSDPASVEEFSNRLDERVSETRCGTLTLLSDRRVPSGDLMRVMSIAKGARIVNVQLAEKHD